METTENEVKRVRRELSRLDPWSFWVVREPIRGSDLSVVGTTGAFAIATCALDGYVKATPMRFVVGGRPVGGLRRLRAAARTMRNRLLASSFDVRVEPIVCFTRAFPAPGTTVRGVRAVNVERIVEDIADRTRIVDAKRAERVAAKLRSGGRP
ncbi:MAG: nuclease-related domain-containing protein [Actinomycetota bacterium]